MLAVHRVLLIFKKQKSCDFVSFAKVPEDTPMLAASEAPPERHFSQPRLLIPAKRHMGTPHVAKIVANFVFFKNILCFSYRICFEVQLFLYFLEFL